MRFKIKKSSISFFLLLLFYMTGAIFIITGKVLNNYVFILLLLFLIISRLTVKTISNKIVIYTCCYMMLLIFALLMSQLYNISIKNAIYQLLYYIKPMLFFLVGYYYIDRKEYNKLVCYVFLIMCLGTIYTYFKSNDLIAIINSRMSELGYQSNSESNKAHIWVFNPVYRILFGKMWITDGGLILRNPTLLLSPLESGFVLAFISSFFMIKSNLTSKKYYLLYIISIILLITTFVRTSWIYFIISFLLFHLMDKNKIKKAMITGSFIIVFIIVFNIFNEQIKYLLFHESSASIHNDNLSSGLKHIFKYIFGTGLGSSGWRGDTLSKYYLYSEGSIITSIIENGIQFVFVYMILFVKIFERSPKIMLPLLIAFLTGSFLLPMGFSTFFGILFFTMLGMILNRKKNVLIL